MVAKSSSESLELADQCCLARRPLQVITFGNEVENWRIGEVTHANPLERLVSPNCLSDNLFTWVVGYTPGYDAVLFCGNGIIRFVQVTACAKPSLKLYAAVLLLRELENRGIAFTNVDFVVIRPWDDTRHFRLELPVGSFQGEWRTLDNEDWESGGRARGQVRQVRVAWG